MKATIPAILVRRPIGPLLGLLICACALAGPSTARAGCSHPAVSHRGQQASPHFLDPLLLGASGESREDASSTPMPHPLPCSGPSCSGYPGPPTVPAVFTARPVEQWAWMGVAAPMPGPGSILFAPPVEGLAPTWSGPSIFHPPRIDAPSPIS